MTIIKSSEWCQEMREEGFTVPFQHAFQLSLGFDEMAKEKRNTFTPPLDSFRSLITSRIRRHLLNPVSAESGLIKEK